MTTQIAKLFTNGRSQAVRLPKEFRFEGSEVYIRKTGDEVILSTKKLTWNNFFKSKSVFDDDFLSERDNQIPQERDFY
ncbi:type II toxin-antitoxin system VapB family antitoxin [Candidatus Halobeggiatoa sp. HSG11]|nr:type II toxin-antitoxin system VapB family antitoxin [Candidatus Halobeggiatoa sp. HSG11]